VHRFTQDDKKKFEKSDSQKKDNVSVGVLKYPTGILIYRTIKTLMTLFFCGEKCTYKVNYPRIPGASQVDFAKVGN